MTLGRFETFLKAAIGLDVSSIGSGAIDRAVRERAAACNSGDLEAYWVRLTESAGERQELIESVVVPETWFFREPGAFAALGHLARERCAIAGRATLRLLSVPCSTGEEPYSMAMALLDAGVEPTRFAIDAVDISARAIECARAGHYKRNSFRGGEQGFRGRYFTADRLHESVRGCVQFRQANLFELDAPVDNQRYDVVFCRNLLIYFDRATQDRAVKVLTALLAQDGVLVVGPSEGALLISQGFQSINWPMSFAFHCPCSWGSVESRATPVMPANNAVRPPQTLSVAKRSLAGIAAQRSARRPRYPTRVEASSDATPLDMTAARPEELLQEAQQLADRGDGSAARDCCERLLQIAGPSAPAYYLLGLLHDAAGETQRAIEFYRRVLYLDPHHHEALIHLAIIVEGAGDLVAARRLYERAKRSASGGAAT